MKSFVAWLTTIFHHWGFSSHGVEIAITVVLFIILLFIAWVANLLTKYVIVKIVEAIIKKTKNDYDDVFIQHKAFNNLSHIIPALIIYFGVPFTSKSEVFIGVIRDLTYVYLIIAILLVINKILNALNDIYEIYAEKRQINVHIKQFIQVVKIIFIIIAIILIISVILHKKPGAILAGLGAMTAVLMLIFRDSILSFVAGIQLTAYQMVKEGDWITVPSRGIDGDVMDISLNTVKIRNFDKTISTIPTYALVQESFINWKGMEQSGGRRIKRSIYIDMNSIKIADNELVEKLRKISFLKEIIEQENTELSNDLIKIAENQAITNITLFRHYIEAYIRKNFRVYKKYKKQTFIKDSVVIERFVIDDPEEFKADLGKYADKYTEVLDGKLIIKDVNKFLIHFSDKYVLENNYLYKVNKRQKTIIVKGTEVKRDYYEKILIKPGLFCDDLTMLVRELPPSEKGLPIEVYVFAATTDWATYEQIQARLIEHLLAVIPLFELRAFQQPAGSDFNLLLNKSN